MAALIIALLEHPEQQTQVVHCLGTTGQEVLVVDCFARARVALEERSFDLIISDVHLENGGTVFDFLKWVKSEQKLCHIPFILFSLQPTKMAKYLADGVQTTARILGASKYISMESFNSAIFAREIAELLPSVETAAPQVIAKEGE